MLGVTKELNASSTKAWLKKLRTFSLERVSAYLLAKKSLGIPLEGLMKLSSLMKLVESLSRTRLIIITLSTSSCRYVM